MFHEAIQKIKVNTFLLTMV